MNVYIINTQKGRNHYTFVPQREAPPTTQGIERHGGKGGGVVVAASRGLHKDRAFDYISTIRKFSRRETHQVLQTWRNFLGLVGNSPFVVVGVFGQERGQREGGTNFTFSKK